MRRPKPLADSRCNGIASVRARNADKSMRLRGNSTAVIRATGLPRRVMQRRPLDQLAQMCLGVARLTLLIVVS
jgi:hypothetical protein